jgi:predicted dehydrogenase
MGGGELIDTGYHPSYLLLYLAGSAPVEVVAMNSTYRLSIDGEDSAQVLVRFANGAVGNIVTSWAYDAPPGTWKFQVVCERGYLYADNSTLHYRPLGEEPVAISFESINTFSAEIADFVACLRERRRPIQTETDGIAVLKVILGSYQSQAEKRIVSLGE